MRVRPLDITDLAGILVVFLVYAAYGLFTVAIIMLGPVWLPFAAIGYMINKLVERYR